MLPITELRATIPFYLARHPELPIWFVFIAAILGNMVPNIIILWCLPQLTEWLHEHAAPRINSTVLWLHDVFVENNRMQLLYLLVILLTGLGQGVLYQYNISNFIWYLAVLIVIPLWSYIMYLVAHKAYQAAIEEKSIIHWFYAKVSAQHSDKFYRWGGLALILIVGIPIPGTGSWTGSLLAFLFNIPMGKALFYIFLGIVMAACIVTALSTGVLNSLGVI
ncbi:MAG: small multi-drug export protein [Candidatus Gracilibacteria bacterium]|nr:small multi-drug export protein [Candidatus Gracilibacteria bacterium]